MTPVPVVSTPLNTRTVRELWLGTEWVPIGNILLPEADREAVWSLAVGDEYAARERLVADPAFVVLPEVPDLTCRNPRCAGGRVRGMAVGNNRPYLNCPSCGGSGVSPVYAATEQWRTVLGIPTPGPWREMSDQKDPDLLRSLRNTECRQLVEWRARRVEPLPVRFEGDDYDWTDAHVLVDSDGVVMFGPLLTNQQPLDDEPWAADLQPGMCVLRLSDWEHLEQPYTEMACNDCGGHGSLTCCAGYGRVPLSVPDGVLSWMELTR